MIALLATADSFSQTHLNFQKFLLEAVFCTIPHNELLDFNFDIPFRDADIQVIGGEGHHGPLIERSASLKFDQQLLTEFRMFRWIFTQGLRISFLPPSVQTLRIEHCQQEFELQCRHLPRDAQEVHLCGNRIFGTLDLQSLPRNLVRFNIHRNTLHGEFSLIDLPATMKSLDITENGGLGQEVVYYQNIPPQMTSIRLIHVKAVRPTADKYRVNDKRIFYFERM